MPNSNSPEFDGRSFGKLEGSMEAIKNDFAEMLRCQKESEKSAAIGRRRIYRKFDHLMDRMSKVDGRMERLEDRVDTHGKAIEDFETFQEDQLSADRVEASKIENNGKWIKGIITGVGVLGAVEGDHATGGKVWKAITGFFK